ncbi:pathogenesis related homeodomain protein A isoform X1 [Tasmannia lanceolata]|uniref:pathogenesis related homeodomain protein A isoform X1 n=1 Tax=Tasmannia lanceolata TaxID=3420 RepID=UPI00406428D3
MRNPGKRFLCQTSRNSFSKREIGSTLNSWLQNKSNCRISNTKRCKLKPRSHIKTIGSHSFLSKRKACEVPSSGSRNNSMNGKRMRRKINSSKKQSSLKFLDGKSSPLSRKGNVRNGNDEGRIQMEQRKRKQKKETIEKDEASRLQRRTRYLLIKMKLEQNLIDAYSGEGWKGQSREKIKPEKELQRAEKQILKCKLGIRDAICQLDLLSSEGRIEDSVIDPDGRVFHEHIFCAKCKLRDAFPDNDIILCDGTCNCAFHQKCLEPPLATENIPPGDQGWFCKFCDCKMEILESINAHLSTRFTVNTNWQDIFKEAAMAADGENTSLDPAEEWPSEDSEDDDYDPERTDNGCNTIDIEENMSDDASSCSGLFWSCAEVSSLSGRSLNNVMKGESSDNSNDGEITSSRRQRRDVDYKKMYDEMFGKDMAENDQLSEDEDWGPGRRKRRPKESDVGTDLTNCDDEDPVIIKFKKNLPSTSEDKKPLFRIPSNAVEKLRRVFAENELPSRAVKENLSKQLGIASEKISKWFKNARYTALKIRKEKLCCNSINEVSNKETGKNQTADRATSKPNSYLVSSLVGVHIPKKLRRIRWRKSPKSITIPLKKQHKKAAAALPTNALEKLRAAFAENQFPSISAKRNLAKQFGIPYIQVNMWFSNAGHFKKQMNSLKRKTTSGKTINSKKSAAFVRETNEIEGQYLIEMERLFNIEDRLEKLKKVLRTCRDEKHVSNEIHSSEQLVIYVPVAEVKEKV